MSEAEDNKMQAALDTPASDNFQLDNYPFYLISLIDRLYSTEIEGVSRKHKIERTRWQILLILREKSPSSISEISKRSGMKMSTLSKVLERMRHDDLVFTKPHQSDHRITDVFINDAGLQAFDKLVKVISKQYEHIMAGFSREEIEQLRDQLQRILANLGRSPYERYASDGIRD